MFWKGAFILLAVLILQIPVLLVRVLIDDREYISSQAEEEVSAQWGGRQVIYAPELAIPYKYFETDDKGRKTISDRVRKVTSSKTEVTGHAEVSTLKKSIYEIPVYKADIMMQGTFFISEEDMDFYEDKIYLDLPIGKMSGLEDEIVATICGKEYPFALSDDGLRIELQTEGLSAGKVIDYSLSFRTKGARTLNFTPNSDSFKVRLSSDHPSPGFEGAYLPDVREITDNGFEAEWNLTKYNTFGIKDSAFGVDLIVPVSQYQQTTRAAKYSFLIMILIFVAVFLAETILRQEVSYIQYIVTGLSLCLFYLLLLSISEYVAFQWAYLIASTMTVAALCGYFMGFLKTKTALACTAAVAVLYAFVFMLLSMETGSLLTGSLALFVILSIIMYYTRNNADHAMNGDPHPVE